MSRESAGPFGHAFGGTAEPRHHEPRSGDSCVSIFYATKRGTAHAFRHVAPLTAAVDEAGRNLMTWLRENDDVAWYPVPAAWASTDSMVDTRSHLALTFAKPAGVERAWLLSHASTGDWGSTAIRTMLGYRGDRLPEFYAAVNGSELYQSQLHDWNEREELFELFPEMWCGDHWTRLDFIPGAGPVVSESRAIALDLSQVPGDQVRIRLHPPIGFWRLNSFRLAWGDDAPRVTRVAARSAIDDRGHNVAAELAADDDRYLTFPTRSDFARLEYPAPPVPRGARRTVFAETSGWYEVNVHQSGPPNLAAITRLQTEPGFAVRQLARDYREFLRTRTLPGIEIDSLASW